MSAVTIETGCARPLVLCVDCGPFGPFLYAEARAFKAAHSLKHQRERDAQAARARRAGVTTVTTSRYDFEDLQ